MKPVCKNFGADGNVFFMAAQVTRTLKRAGMHEQAKEFSEKLKLCKGYDEALVLMMDYIEPELGDEENSVDGWGDEGNCGGNVCHECDCEDDE